MKGLLGCLFILLLGIFIILFKSAQILLNFFLGTPQHPRNTHRTNAHSNRTSRSQYTNTSNAHHESSGKGTASKRRNKKIFEKNEGKYVDFEEV